MIDNEVSRKSKAFTTVKVTLLIVKYNHFVEFPPTPHTTRPW